MNKLTCWLSWINRQKIVILVASLLLCLGCVFPWYKLPPQSLEIFKTDLFWINILRILPAILAVFSFSAVFLYGIHRLPRVFLWVVLMLVLLFPYAVTTWSPTITFLATSYSDQNSRVSAHIGQNFSEVQTQWKQNIRLNRSKPTGTIFDLTIEDSRFFQVSSWDRIWLDGFGYKNSFFAFIGSGWGFTITGLIICLVGAYMNCQNNGLNSLLRDLNRFLPILGALLSIIVCFLIWVNLANYNLAEQFAKGEYIEVVSSSRHLAFLYPPLRGDTFFMERLAKASLYRNEPDQPLVNFTKGLEHYRLDDFNKARDYFQKSLDAEPKNFLVRDYLASTLLNQGVDYFNDSTQIDGRRAGGAIDLFEQLLQVFPNHVEGLYDLMIAKVVNGEFDESAQIAKQIIDVNKYLQVSNLSLVAQAYLHLSWKDFLSNNITEAWKYYRQSIDDSTWKKSSKVDP